jgi:hypothetical protein
MTQNPTKPEIKPAVAFTELVVLVKMYDGDQVVDIVPVKMNVTAYADTPAQAIEQLSGCIDGVNVKPYLQLTGPTQAPAQVQGTPPQAPTQAQAPQAPSTTPTAGGVILAERMTLTPRPDGKMDVCFYSAGHKYPDLKATWTPAQAAARLSATGKAWNEHNAAIAGDYAVQYKVSWVPSSNLNKNGVPYKNITEIGPA